MNKRTGIIEGLAERLCFACIHSQISMVKYIFRRQMRKEDSLSEFKRKDGIISLEHCQEWIFVCCNTLFQKKHLTHKRVDYSNPLGTKATLFKDRNLNRQFKNSIGILLFSNPVFFKRHKKRQLDHIYIIFWKIEFRNFLSTSHCHIGRARKPSIL